MRELVEYIAKALVDNPDAVKVIQFRGAHATILRLRVAPEDKGIVIGKRGRVANSIRSLLRVASSGRRGGRVVLEIA